LAFEREICPPVRAIGDRTDKLSSLPEIGRQRLVIERDIACQFASAGFQAQDW